MTSQSEDYTVTAASTKCTLQSIQSSASSSCLFEDGELLDFIETIYEDFTKYSWSSREMESPEINKFSTDALLLDLSVDKWSTEGCASSSVSFFDMLLTDEHKPYQHFEENHCSTVHTSYTEDELFTPLDYWISSFPSTARQFPSAHAMDDPAIKEISNNKISKISESILNPRVLSSRCVSPGCSRTEQTNGLCIRHGGGRRCSVTDCNRGAQAQGRCKKHGGGTRCKVIGCSRSNQGGGFCRSHGGGKLCTYPGCKKGVQRKGYCSTHGGSRLCKITGCSRVDRGGGFCGQHKKDNLL